jgi:hypothetical protein
LYGKNLYFRILAVRNPAKIIGATARKTSAYYSVKRRDLIKNTLCELIKKQLGIQL